MFIEPTIDRVPLGFSGYIGLDTKIVFKKSMSQPNVCLGALNSFNILPLV